MKFLKKLVAIMSDLMVCITEFSHQ